MKSDLVSELTELLGRPPKNINECNDGIRDAENHHDARTGMGNDYMDCYNKTKNGSTVI